MNTSVFITLLVCLALITIIFLTLSSNNKSSSKSNTISTKYIIRNKPVPSTIKNQILIPNQVKTINQNPPRSVVPNINNNNTVNNGVNKNTNSNGNKLFRTVTNPRSNERFNNRVESVKKTENYKNPFPSVGHS